MTRNQIDAKKAREEERANRVREHENERSNRAKESIEYRKDKTTRAGQSLAAKTKLTDTVLNNLLGTAKEGTKSLMQTMGYAAAQHPEWYDKVPELTTGVARYPTNYPSGTPINGDGVTVSITLGDESEAYLMCAYFDPVFGVSKDGSSIVNTISKKIYSNIRHANSGSANTEHQDVTINLIAVDSIYMMIADLTRLYTLAKMYQARNRSIPKAILLAYGIEETDLLNNVGPLYNSINMLINKASMFVVPADMTITTRHMWLCANILANPERQWSEMYMYRPLHVARFAIDAESGAGYIRYDPWGANYKPTIAEKVNYVNEAINSLTAQEDSGIMAGDILKAYGDKIFRLNPIPLDLDCSIVTDSNALEQFANIRICPWSVQSYRQNVDEGYIYSEFTLPANQIETRIADILNRDKYVRIWKPEATPAELLSRTRNIFSSNDAELTSIGSELINEVVVYDTLRSPNGAEQVLSSYLNQYYVTPSSSTGIEMAASAFTNLPRVGAFEYAPLMWVLTNSDDASLVRDIVFGDHHYFAVIPNEGIKAMNDVALNSELYSAGLQKNFF